jgi:hypothetical protein
MKWTSDDKKAFLIGVLASVAAVIVWDFTKKGLKILNYEETPKKD